MQTVFIGLIPITSITSYNTYMATNQSTSGAMTADLSTEEKIITLFNLQIIDSKLDNINKIKGELPLEVADLEDAVAGLESRISLLSSEVDTLSKSSKAKKEEIENAKALITKYEEQQNAVQNNRQFDALSKEIEYQKLEIELAEKHIKEFNAEAKAKKKTIEDAKNLLDGRKIDLDNKKTELSGIEQETANEIAELEAKAEILRTKVDERLLNAYDRIRKNVRNGLAVVTVKRDACGGCFNQIPPQRQLDIRMSKKVIVCEYCGRILVSDLLEEDAM